MPATALDHRFLPLFIERVIANFFPEISNYFLMTPELRLFMQS